MSISRNVAILLVGLGLAGCKKTQDPRPAARPIEPSAGPRTAGVAEVVPGPDFDIERVDPIRFVIGDDVLVELALAGSAGELAATPTGRGLRLQAIPDDSILARLDLATGDLVLSINELAVPDASALRAAYGAVRRDGEVRLVGERGGAPLTRRYVLRSSFEESDPTRVSRSNSARDQLTAALSTGVKQTGDGHFDIDQRVLAAIAEHPGVVDGATHYGWRSRGVTADPRQPDGFLALGLSKYDLVKAVNDVDVERESALGRELGAQREAHQFTISVVRLREPLILRYRVVEDLVMDADLDAAIAAWQRQEDDNPLRRAPAQRDVDPEPPSLDWITKVGEHEYQLRRDGFDEMLANPMKIASGARVVPAIKDGQPNGFKLYAIRPGSIYPALGLRNGDTILAINGEDISTPDKALEVYSKVRSATSFNVDLERRGKPLRLSYRIK